MIQVFGFWCFSERETHDCSRSNRVNVRIWNVTLDANRVHRQRPKKVTV